MEKNLHMLGAPDFTDVDVAYAKRFQNTLEQKDISASYSMLGLGVQRDKVLDFLPPWVINPMICLHPQMWVMSAGLFPRCNYGGKLCHRNALSHMANGCAGKSAPALKGMVHAATVMAMTGVDAITNPELREAAWAI